MLAEKIMELRKKNGWSQEQLGEKLGVSRQSVSKWETGLAQPELDNILQMSALFDVSTDYLLKEDVAEVSREDLSEASSPESVGAEPIRHVSKEEAVTYMDLARKLARRIALGVSLCILSPIPLLLMAGYTESYGSFSEDIAGGLGMAILLVIVAIGVVVLIWNGLKLSPYGYLEKENIAVDDETRTLALERKNAYETRFRAATAAGAMLCILGVVPLMIAAAFEASGFVLICMVALLFAMVALAVQFFIRAGIPYGSFQKLLQEGDYTREAKDINKKISFVPGVYWCTVTALFLLFGFLTEDWRNAGYIWPVAGILFVAFLGVASAIAKSKK